MRPMRTATGLEAFYRCLALPCDQMMVVEGILSEITGCYLQNTRILKPSSRAEIIASRQPANPAAETETSPDPDQLRQRLKTTLATLLRINIAIIDTDRAFVELGLDSILGMEFVARINSEFRTELPNTTVFDYPTIQELAGFLERQIVKLPVCPPPAPAALVPESPALVAGSGPVLKRRAHARRTTVSDQAHSDDRIAIIGMSGRYPKADNLRQYWQNLVEGRDSIGEVP